MNIAVNDVSFLWGFDTPYNARKALIQFGCVALGLKDERVSKVNAEIDIINSRRVTKDLLLAPDYTLIKALNDIKDRNREQFLLILQILTQCGGEEEECQDEFSIEGCSSKHCAYYRNDFLISIASNELFEKDIIKGTLNKNEECEIRNISNEDHKYIYWNELGFREYELNKKHSNRVYYRSGGNRVNIAPETDELGQKLLNNAVEVNNKLFSVDHENAKRIFEFRHSYANKFHGFLQEDLPSDLVDRIFREDEMNK